MHEAATLLVGLGLGAGAFLVVRTWSVRSRMARRLALASSRRDARVATRLAEATGSVERLFNLLGRFMPLGEKDRDKIASALQRAGHRSPDAVILMLGIKAACLIIGFGAGFGLTLGVLQVQGSVALGAAALGGVLIGVTFNLLPELVLARMAAGRLARIRAAVPDAFDLLIVCLEAGLSFERALGRAVAALRSFRPELADELGGASLSIQMHGQGREEALGQLARRLDIEELADFANVMSQSERHGTPAADMLRKLASSARVEAVSRMQAKMGRLPVLLVIPATLFLLPGMMLWHSNYGDEYKIGYS